MAHLGSPRDMPGRVRARNRSGGARLRTGAVLLLSLAILGWASLFVHGAPPPDVPPHHWAADAVRQVTELGILGTLDGGNFAGEEGVTRYDLAAALARLLQQMEAAGPSLHQADLTAIRQLIDAFQADLVRYYQSRDELEEAANLTHKSVAVLGETLNSVIDRLERQHGENQSRERLRERLWEERFAQLTARLEVLQKENEILSQRIRALEGAGE